MGSTSGVIVGCVSAKPAKNLLTWDRRIRARIILADYHHARARAYLESGDEPSAIDHMESSAALSSDAPEALNNIATTFAEYGKLDIAADYYVRCLEIDPDYVLGLRNLAHVFMMTEDFTRAALVFEWLIRLAPDDIGARFEYAKCLRKLGRVADARTELARLAEKGPNDPRLQRELGLFYINEFGDQLRGREHLLRSYELDPSQMDIAMMLGDPTSGILPGLPGVPDLPNLPK